MNKAPGHHTINKSYHFYDNPSPFLFMNLVITDMNQVINKILLPSILLNGDVD